MTADPVCEQELRERRAARARMAMLEDTGLMTLAEAHRMKLDVVFAVFLERFRRIDPQPARDVAAELGLAYGLVLRADAVLEEAGVIERDSPPRAVRT